MMLAVSTPLSYKNERENYDLFQDFPDGNLIDTVDFDDLFEGINDGDFLPDLEIFAEFSVGSCEESTNNVNIKSKSKEAKKSTSQIKNPQGKRKVKVNFFFSLKIISKNVISKRVKVIYIVSICNYCTIMLLLHEF